VYAELESADSRKSIASSSAFRPCAPGKRDYCVALLLQNLVSGRLTAIASQRVFWEVSPLEFNFDESLSFEFIFESIEVKANRVPDILNEQETDTGARRKVIHPTILLVVGVLSVILSFT
jgi:hypothetical protein